MSNIIPSNAVFYEFKRIMYFVAKVKEKTMANKKKLAGMLAMVLVFGTMVTAVAFASGFRGEVSGVIWYPHPRLEGRVIFENRTPYRVRVSYFCHTLNITRVIELNANRTGAPGEGFMSDQFGPVSNVVVTGLGR